ncbi:MAG: RsmD family RNA methyltransferase [Saprospiraceae bacterium]|nr:RsmD family RNA methyltransferase [Saprospiraceae bacterium]
MRIISGIFKGRKFVPPAKNWPTRPTTDFAKEGLFNILQNRIDFEETAMLDLFGGTGNHCYEFISRGCQDATYVDKFPGCVQFVQKTATELGITDKIKIFHLDVFKFLQTNARKFDYIFAGPPYPLPNLNSIPDEIFKYDTLAPEGLFVLEHNPSHNFKQHLRYTEERNYGTTIFSFFR